jgi:hypothetical protein
VTARRVGQARAGPPPDAHRPRWETGTGAAQPSDRPPQIGCQQGSDIICRTCDPLHTGHTTISDEWLAWQRRFRPQFLRRDSWPDRRAAA